MKVLKFYSDKKGNVCPPVPGCYTFYMHTGKSDPAKAGLQVIARPGDEVPLEDVRDAKVYVERGQAVEIDSTPAAAAGAKS